MLSMSISVRWNSAAAISK